MGSVAATNSIDRVLEAHGDEILQELLDTYVIAAEEGSSPLLREITLVNDVYEIGITAVLANGQELPLRGIPIDELADRFPDCEIGY